MTRISELHKRWIKDATYRKEYEALAEEFELAGAIARRAAAPDSAKS